MPISKDDEWVKVGLKGKALVKKSEPAQSGSGSQSPPIGEVTINKFENACYFNKIGKCRFGKECKKDHPKFCQKFVNNGLLKYNSWSLFNIYSVKHVRT